MIELNDNNFNEEVIKSEKVTLVDVYAPWCGPCKTLAPLLEKLSVENPEFKFCKLNVDENPEFANEHNVRSIPTCFIYKNGEIIDKFTGVKGGDDILKIMQK